MRPRTPTNPSQAILGHIGPDDAPIDATADPVDTTAEDPVLFSDDVVEVAPFTQTNIS